MTYTLLRFAHIIGAVLIGGGLIAVWLSDLRSRQSREMYVFEEAARNIALFYNFVVVPGAVILLLSGSWMIIGFYGGWDFLKLPWLAGMVALFAFEFIEGNTITRIFFMRLRRLSGEAAAAGRFTPQLEKERGRLLPSFTHFLDLPMLFLIIALGAIKPATWSFFVYGSMLALGVAASLTVVMRRLYPKKSS